MKNALETSGELPGSKGGRDLGDQVPIVGGSKYAKDVAIYSRSERQAMRGEKVRIIKGWVLSSFS